MMGKVSPPAAPKEPEPIRIPSPDDPDLMLARKRKMQEETAKRGGRTSTDLTSGASPAYSRTTLG